jgi:hypothetical protein
MMARQRKTTGIPTGVPGDDDTPVDPPIDHPDRGPATDTAQEPVRVTVDVDTLVARPDLGPTSRTFVAAGDEIPLGLEGYDRTPA